MNAVPPWLHRVATTEPVDTVGINPVLNRVAKVMPGTRTAAVLVLFGGDPDSHGLPADADILLTQRAATLREHRGQVAFPGGSTDDGDDGPITTALREAQEETGLDPAGVEPIATLDSIFVPPSRFNVTPVIGYWRTPSPVKVIDPAEAERVVRVPLRQLLDPANRFVVKHPLGYKGPAFRVDNMIVWGFTGGILAGLLAISGWERQWDVDDVRDLESALASVGMAETRPAVPKPEQAALRRGDQ